MVLLLLNAKAIENIYQKFIGKISMALHIQYLYKNLNIISNL